MEDIRLEAGRHHLAKGEAATNGADWASARAHFESALLQFRGPDLLLGEGHAYRGLAGAALGAGDPAEAEARFRQAIRSYRDVRALLDRVDDEGVASEHRNDALEGEAIAQVTLGELLLRQGREAEAREARDWARAAYDALSGRPSEASLWALTGRLAVRDGDDEEAGHAYSRALALHERFGDLAGQATVLRAMAEIARLEDDFTVAEGYLKRALALARQIGNKRLEARTLAGLGAVARQTGDADSAKLAYEQVRELAKKAGDTEMLGFAHLNLGEIHSLEGDADAVSHLREAVRLLGALGVHHAVAAALHHAASHALGLKRYDIALATAEGARRTWRGMDPIRGVGQALRLEVKALAGMRDWRSVLAVAHVRADLVGDSQPNAEEVREFYRQRAPSEWLDEIDALSPPARMADAERRVAHALQPLLERHGLAVTDLGSVAAGLALLDVLRKSDDPALYRDDLDELPNDALEEMPPEDDAFFVIVGDPNTALIAEPGSDESE
ncbi:MAG: tetratricopeptide repeat protein [Alphaproteobacteria bacterium]|nr:tetratricopeptide repeat protein [Alphaproteobacteria bacterium]